MYRRGYYYKDHKNVTLFKNPEIQAVKTEDDHLKINFVLKCTSFSSKLSQKRQTFNQQQFLEHRQHKQYRQRSFFNFKPLNQKKSKSTQKQIQKLTELYRIKNQKIRNYSLTSLKRQRNKSLLQRTKNSEIMYLSYSPTAKKLRNQKRTSQKQQNNRNNQNQNGQIWNRNQIYFSNNSIFEEATKKAFVPACKIKTMRFFNTKQN